MSTLDTANFLLYLWCLTDFVFSNSTIFKNYKHPICVMEVKYVCMECGYKGKGKKFPSMCPYCAKQGGIRDNSMGEAQRNIDELSERF